jgi:hypothetical protein
MNSTFLKIGIGYIAGLLTFGVYQNFEEAKKLDELSLLMRDSTESDTTSMGLPCACDNEARYNVEPREDSQNFPIDVSTCQGMVTAASAPLRTEDKQVATIKGAWFSKVTLDLMFCHAPDANGIYVYKGEVTSGEYTGPTYIVEAARSNKIVSHDDGTSYIYYSHTLCPMVCGACGQ